MKRNTNSFALIALTGALIAAPQFGRTDTYVIRATPANTNAYGMSSNGLVTGEGSGGHAFVFDGTNFTDFGNGPFGTYFLAQGINAAGNVVGFSTDNTGTTYGVYAFNPSNEGIASGFGYTCELTDVSDRITSGRDADFCGIGAYADGTFHAIGFDTVTDAFIGFPEPAGTVESFSQKISNDGAVVGYYLGKDTPSGFNGFYWNQDGNYVIPSGTLAGGHLSEMYGIDGAGTIVCGFADQNGNDYAVTWTGGPLMQLPPSNPNHINDAAFGVRSDGRAVGVGVNAADTTGVATVWTSNSAQDLNTISVNPDGTAPKFILSQGLNINEAGQIVCTAYDPHNNNTSYGVRLDPVGPVTVTLPKKAKASFKGTLTLNVKAPTNVFVTLSSDNPRVSFANTQLEIKKGKTSAMFTARVAAGPHGQTLTVTATDSGLSATGSTTTK